MDCDLPFVSQLRTKGINVKYFLEVTPHSKQSTFLNIETLYPKAGVFKADIYKKELSTIQEVLDWENTFVINRVSRRHLHYPTSYSRLNCCISCLNKNLRYYTLPDSLISVNGLCIFFEKRYF